MKRKIVSSLMIFGMAMTLAAGCGQTTTETTKAEETTETEETTKAEETSETEETTETEETKEYTYEEKNNCFLITSTEFVYEGEMFMDYQSTDPQDNEIKFVDVEGWPEYAIYDSINLYAGTGQVNGYTKENAICQLCATSEEGWGVIIIDGRTVYIRMEDFEGNNTSVKWNADKEEYDIPERGTITDTTSTSNNTTTNETTTPNTASNSTTVENNNNTTAKTSETETPSSTTSVDNSSTTVEVEEKTQVADSGKYTPEEAIAAYRAIMESNGMTWDPSLPSDGASWGTGWIYLKKSSFEEQVQSALKGYAYGDGGGTPTTRYYFEVTGSDDNKVNVTVWGA
jgi:hypothetical protein